MDIMSVVEKDQILKQIQCEIKRNRNNMVSDLVDINKMKDTNIFLRDVYDDYRSYYNFIVNQKKDQEIQILRLLHYLEKSMLEANLTDKMVRQAKTEQQNLLGKLDEVRSDLAEIVDKSETLK